MSGGDLPRLISYVLPSFLVTTLIWYLWNPFPFNIFCILSGLSVISWTLGYYFFEIHNTETISTKNKLVMVTGCDSGFGHRTAIRLDQLGFHVFATVMFPDGEGAQTLRARCSDRLTVVRMDITKPEDVEAVVEQIKSTQIPFWGLINNAGIGYSVPADWGHDVDIYVKTFNVNVFGHVRVTKSCMPLLRQSRGRIVNIASVAGRINSPWMGHYCMSKHSIRCYGDVLRRELRGSGIKVITIEPSFFRTQIVNFEQLNKTRETIFQQTPEDIRKYYGEDFLKFLSETDKMVNRVTKDNLDEVVDSILKGVTRIYPKLFYRCGTYLEVITLWAASHMPEILLDAFIALVTNRKMPDMNPQTKF